MIGRVLVVAGSDSGGGAGLQADVKTITALGGYAATAVTALTAQNTLGVHRIVPVEPEFVEEQMRVVLEDLGADVIKTGMLASVAVVRAVARAAARWAPGVPLVVDPVMIAKGGAPLLAGDAVQAVLDELVPRAALLTPNAPEASALTGVRVQEPDDLGRAAEQLLLRGAGAALVKGGHLEGDTIVDVLRTADGDEERFTSERVLTLSTHGTGCTLASAIAVGLAQGLTLRHAVARAHGYVRRAIETAPGWGQGHGPLNHAHPLEPRPGSAQGTREALH
ncbi:MAG: bifunctional hydroxymethylpyrimidine kinase/phosphomethylpyrimidine kinase [Polyangiaceae bacterium]|nr:bifunctional hydroxymethylpyrimidine kinase/phosphomethylpyrimidine kinase [Polyangiaceae bacterium]